MYSSCVVVLGAEVEDSGRIGCRRLGDSDDDNVGYVDLKVFGKTRCHFLCIKKIYYLLESTVIVKHFLDSTCLSRRVIYYIWILKQIKCTDVLQHRCAR